ncbi:hypothetical protein GKZ68_18170 [Hymenobacter sp. BRD128]|uniref:hypothetical protein n=1 Tax=Hymenobacter sp. BRD128 TaxID=2675878 RepID=UPI0015632FC4|nr:hypothetical protein [Hymenobacter sp. BRD128]QKG58385.1 hypothetical protein GKZ68_18170 [Hymenobacter sp. BRD128]
MEDYAAKMALKPEAALREYVKGHAQYREEAVLAALDELRRRGLPAPEEASLRPQLEAVVRTQQAEAATRASELSRSETQAVPEEEQPVLYTPGVIVLFSVLFNTIITGAVLLAINLRRLKQTKAIWGLVAFVLAYLVAEAAVVNLLMQRYVLSPWFVSLLNLPAILVYIFWFWPRYVGTYQFQPRGWLIPLLVCFIIVMGLGMLLTHIPGAAQLMKQQTQQAP